MRHWINRREFIKGLIGIIFTNINTTINNDKLLAGASRVNITPVNRQYMAGFKERRISAGVHDDIYASILILKSNTTLTLISLDLIGLFYNDVLHIRSMIKNSVGDKVIIGCTHNHSGPDTLGYWGPLLFDKIPIRSGIDPNYLLFIKKKIVKGVNLALSNMKKARIRFGKGRIEGVSINKRRERLLDKEISVMGVEDVRGVNIATLVNYACHPEVLWIDNRLITSDFVGYLYRYLREKTKGIILFFNGALGGMVVPKIRIYSNGKGMHTFNEAKRIGELIGNSAYKLLKSGVLSTNSYIHFKRKVIYVPLDNIKFRIAKEIGIFKRRLYNGRVKTEVSVIKIGDAKIVTVPGEPLPSVGFRIKNRIKERYRFIFGVTNDELGYIMERNDYDNPIYSYEKSMSIGKDVGEIVIYNISKILY